MADVEIRPVRAADRATLLRFVGGFQDYERGLHPNRRPAAEVTEDHLAGRGFNRVRLSVLAANADARAIYEKRGYRAYEVIYEKPLGGHRA